MNNEQSVFNQIIAALRKSFYFLLFFSICINILMLTVPIYMLQIYDYVLTSQSVDSLIYLSVIATFALIIYGILDLSRSRILVVISSWLNTNLSPRARSPAPPPSAQPGVARAARPPADAFRSRAG